MGGGELSTLLHAAGRACVTAGAYRAKVRSRCGRARAPALP